MCRKGSEGAHVAESSTTGSTSPRSSASDYSRSKSSPRLHCETTQEWNDEPTTDHHQIPHTREDLGGGAAEGSSKACGPPEEEEAAASGVQDIEGEITPDGWVRRKKTFSFVYVVSQIN